jgi:hypothetical protein
MADGDVVIIRIPGKGPDLRIPREDFENILRHARANITDTVHMGVPGHRDSASGEWCRDMLGMLRR